jgi:hypothetical protein
VIGLVITGVSRGVTTAVERSIQEQIAIAAETDRSLDLTEIYFAFFVLDGGLKAGLEYLASLETLGTAESGETSLERVDVTNNSIIYRNRILDDTVMGTNPEWEANLREHFCKNYDLDLSRFRSGLLRAILAIKETGYGSDTQRRVQAGCSSHRDDQRPDEASGCV